MTPHLEPPDDISQQTTLFIYVSKCIYIYIYICIYIYRISPSIVGNPVASPICSGAVVPFLSMFRFLLMITDYVFFDEYIYIYIYR